MEVVFDYAIASGWRVDNPAIAVTKVLPRRRGKKEHHPAMAYGKAARVHPGAQSVYCGPVHEAGVGVSDSHGGTDGRSAVHGVGGSGYTEAATWTVPASRMKARKEHRVPLSRRALVVLEEARKLGTGRGLVFPSRRGKPLSNMAFNMLLRRLEVGDAVPHGFRSTFKDWTLEETSFPWAVVEAALAHTLGSATESAYARSDLFDKRRELMETWARHCERGGVPPTVAELPEGSCVMCYNAIPEERSRLDTCSPGCAAIMAQARRHAGSREWRRRQGAGMEEDAGEETSPVAVAVGVPPAGDRESPGGASVGSLPGSLWHTRPDLGR